MSRSTQTVERWDVFELTLNGPAEGNPFLDVELFAVFSQGHRRVRVRGFYDGEGVYRVRWSPDAEGPWRYATESNASALDGVGGEFECGPAGPGNRGPVHVQGQSHFRYADGSPHFSLGTTCYAWVHQGDDLAERTLATLRDAPFNKLRMTVFPKHYRYNENEPPCYAFPVTARGDSAWPGEGERDRRGWAFDLERFDVGFWRMLERRIGQLRDLGVEADVILFHPYDRWGFAHLPPDVEDRYLRYAVARLASCRNVWWSFANEWDLMRDKSIEDWERYARVVCEEDPYGRLRSIHNCHRWYDHRRPWVTHCSIQAGTFDARRWHAEQRKPLVLDEICYEGTVNEGWGNISGREMVSRCWQLAVLGAHPGHSEVMYTPEHVMWWNKGGELRGQSPPRLAFLRQIVESGPARGIEPYPDARGDHPMGWKGPEWLLAYTAMRQPGWWDVKLPAGRRYRVEHIDTWEMTIETVDTVIEATERRVPVPMPGRPHVAVRFTSV